MLMGEDEKSQAEKDSSILDYWQNSRGNSCCGILYILCDMCHCHWFSKDLNGQ